MQPVATAKAQENGQCHNHGLAHNAQTMGEYSGCHRMSWFVKPTGWYSHLGALWIVARSWTMRKTILTIYYLRWFGHTSGAYPKFLQHPKWEESFHNPRVWSVWSIPWVCWIFLRHYTYDSHLNYLPEDSGFPCLILSWRLNHATYCDHRSSELLGTQRFIQRIPVIPATCWKQKPMRLSEMIKNITNTI